MVKKPYNKKNEMKICSICKRWKPLHLYGNDGNNKLCYTCCERRALYSRTYREKHPKKAILKSARINAKKLGVTFSLKEEDIKIPKICPVLQIPIKNGEKRVGYSIDRIIPEKGYVKDNIKIISDRANRLKNNASIEELKLLVAYLDTHNNRKTETFI